jgi:hypothetical protein
MGYDVVELDDSAPFTAARGRNAGLAWLLEHHRRIAYVQFVDGDCELDHRWIERGLAELAMHRDMAVVFGRINERFPQQSVYHRLCAIEWDTPYGDVTGSGGIAIMRVNSLREVGLFDGGIVAAEDTELCARLRRAKWRIQHIDAPMALHDASMSRFAQWWRRSMRTGYAFAQVDAKGRASRSQPFSRQRRSIWGWAGLLPLSTLALAWPTHGASLLLLGSYAILGVRVYRRKRAAGLNAVDACLYAAHCVLAKFPQLVGQIRYHIHRAVRKPPQLIEHKRPLATRGAEVGTSRQPSRVAGPETAP